MTKAHESGGNFQFDYNLLLSSRNWFLDVPVCDTSNNDSVSGFGLLHLQKRFLHYGPNVFVLVFLFYRNICTYWDCRMSSICFHALRTVKTEGALSMVSGAAFPQIMVFAFSVSEFRFRFQKQIKTVYWTQLSKGLQT